MTERTVAKLSMGTEPLPRYELDDDNISVTSTAVSVLNSEAEYPVKGVLFETILNNEPYFCIEWDGYPREQGTYERVADLDPELIDMWKETKMRRDRGLEEPFTAEQFEALKHKAKMEKRQRRRLRRKKRIRLGYDPGSKISSDEEGEIALSEENGHSSESNIKTSDMPDKIKDASGIGLAQKPKRVSCGIFGNASRQNRINQWDSDSDEYDGSAISDDLIVANSSRKRPSSAGTDGQSYSGVQSAPKRRMLSSLSKDNKDDGNPPHRSKVPNNTLATSTGYQGTARPSNNHPIQQNVSGPRVQGLATRETTRGGPSGLQVNPRNVLQSLQPVKEKSKLLVSESSKDKKTEQYDANMSDVRRTGLYGRLLEDKAPYSSMPGRLFSPASGHEPKNPASVPTPVLDTMSESEFDDTPMIFDEPQETDEDLQTTTPSDKQTTEILEKSSGKAANSDKDPLDETVAAPQQQAPKKTVSSQDHNTTINATWFGDNTVTKEVKFGTAAKPITITFEGLDSSSSESWIKDLCASKAVVFNHICFAKAFLRQIWEKFCTKIIRNGAVMTDNENMNTLESLQMFLSQRLAGLVCQYSDFVILLYPAGCKEWRWKNIYSAAIQNESTPASYILFKMSVGLASFLRLPVESASASSTATVDFKGHRKALVDSMHNLEFDNLSPVKVALPRKFFIFFPSNSLPSLEFITAWLKACDPDCEVIDCLTSTVTWARHTMEAKPAPTTVIMHHSVVPITPWLSGVHRLIVNTTNFWSVGCKLSAPGVESVVAPYTRTRIFPHGAAVLLTPSFIVAEPRQLQDFLERFFKRHRDAIPGTYKLVGCYKLRDYLLEIAAEKAAERKELLTNYRNFDGDVEGIATKEGLGFQECEARFECYLLVKQMMEQENMPIHYYPWDLACPREQTSPVIYAGDLINQDSEEALIKWFAGWAMQNVEQHRMFIVLASGKSASMAVRYKDIVKETMAVNEPAVSNVECPQQNFSAKSTIKAVDSTRNSFDKGSPSSPTNAAAKQAPATSAANNDDPTAKARYLTPEALMLHDKLEHFMLHTGITDDQVAMQYLADADADMTIAIKLFNKGAHRYRTAKPQTMGPPLLHSLGHADAPSNAGIVDCDGKRHSEASRQAATSEASPTQKAEVVERKAIRYTSTLAWYSARKKAGKSWEHLHIMSWETAIDWLKSRLK